VPQNESGHKNYVFNNKYGYLFIWAAGAVLRN
jgi:hypothetical protein